MQKLTRMLGTFFGFILLASTLLFMHQIAIAAPNAPTGINQFSIAPDPKLPGGSVTGTMNIDVNPGGASSTRFCLYKSTGLLGTLPTDITLTFVSGFSSTDVTFTGSTPGTTCPSYSGLEARLYSANTTNGGGSIPANSTTTLFGTFNYPINASQPAGLYTWRLIIEHPASSPNALDDTLTILGPTAVNLQGISGQTGNHWALSLPVLFLLGSTTFILIRRKRRLT
ncbi:MAG: hypothetical protein D6706_11540 [Chloroflexi bacterium]|nr:MAG: hypothetical protein D6706_11540 [Chloroflexota bacterium]